MPNIPEKRTNPFEKTLNEMRNAQTELEEKKDSAKKAPAKKEAAKKEPAKKATTKKETTKKAASKKAATTKKAPAKVKIDAKTGTAKVVAPKTKKVAEKKTETKKATTKATTTKKATTKAPAKKAEKKVEQAVEQQVPQIAPVIVETPVVEIAPVQVAPEAPVKKPRKISKRAQLLKEQKAAERAAAKAAKMMPVEIIRPEPKKLKLATKEEKAQFKKLEESFDYIVNLASVVEEKTMDKEEIPDITLGELHVIQMVKKFNNKPMTLIANNLKVTVGSLITCLNRLIQKDYIIRTRDEMDNRVILLSITPKAQKVLKAHDKFHTDILGLLLENGVTLPQATKVLSTLALTLEVYYDPIHNSFTKEEKGSKAKKK